MATAYRINGDGQREPVPASDLRSYREDPAASLAKCKAAALASIRSASDEIVDAVTAGYSSAERDTWPSQEREAREVTRRVREATWRMLSDEDVRELTPALYSIAGSARAVPALADVVLTKAAAFLALGGGISRVRRTYGPAIEEAASVQDVETVTSQALAALAAIREGAVGE